MTHARMARHFKFIKSPIAEKNHLVKRLDLTAKQIKQTSPILDVMLPKQTELFKIHRGQMDALRDSMFTSITPFLNATQKDKVNKMRRTEAPTDHNDENLIADFTKWNQYCVVQEQKKERRA